MSVQSLSHYHYFNSQSIVCGLTSASFVQIPPITFSITLKLLVFSLYICLMKGSRVRYKKINNPGYRWRLDRFIIGRANIMGVILCSVDHAFLRNRPTNSVSSRLQAVMCRNKFLESTRSFKGVPVAKQAVFGFLLLIHFGFWYYTVILDVKLIISARQDQVHL